VDATQVAVALGSNLGDRTAHLEYAISRLRPVLQELRCSSFRETEPVGVPAGQPPYLNAVVVGECLLPAVDLMRSLLEIEQERGRQRPYRNAPRTLDLDLILFGSTILESPDLVLPHPRFRERRFVLEPLAEIAPAMRDPVSGLTMAGLLAGLSRLKP